MSKIKNTILSLRYKKAILPAAVLLFFLFIITERAEAINPSGAVLDPFRAMMEGLSPYTGPWVAIIIIIFMFFAISTSFAYISASLLENAIETSNESISILQGEVAFVVQAGWSFMAGVVNMMLLIAFLVIAIAIIMGSDSFGLKKALPRIIIIAFLVNFTLLFVGMAIDITNIAYNTIANHFSQNEGGSILWDALNPLFNLSMMILIGSIATFISLVGAVFFTPVAPIVHATGALTILLSPFLIQYIIISIILLLLSFTFLLFYAVFIMRSLIINILAILSPLAFFCLIFPSTKRYFTLWLHHLLQWLMVGVVFIFFMYIAFALAPLAMELGVEAEKNLNTNFFLSWWTSAIIPYIILLIYFITILGVTRKMIPELATMVMDQARSAVAVVAPYMQVAGNAVAKDFRKRYSEQQAERMGNDPVYRAGVMQDLTATPPAGSGFLAQADAMWRRKKAQIQMPTQAATDVLNDRLDSLSTSSENDHVNKLNDSLRRGNYPEALAAIKSAQSKDFDVSGILRRLSVDDFKKIKIHADIVGETKNLEKMMLTQSLQAKNYGIPVADQQKNRMEAIDKLSPDDMKALSSNMIKQGADASDPARQAEANEILKEIAFSSKAQVKAFAEGGGKDAVDSLRSNIIVDLTAPIAEQNRQDENRQRVLSALSKEGGSRFLSESERKDGRDAAKNGL